MTEIRSPWKATVLTLFPEMFPGPLGWSVPGRAMKEDVWSLETLDIRAFAGDKHASVDDTPFGGGPGMVMRPDVIDAAIESLPETRAKLIYLSPRGKPLTQHKVRELAAGPGVNVLCGRYEGVDERVIEARGAEEISVGDYILSGGEPAAIALIDACVRLLPGAVGSEHSLVEESFETGLLEYPQYTRPKVWKNREVPEVLLSGHHGKIEAWRLLQAETITRERRPDLWSRYGSERNLKS